MFQLRSLASRILQANARNKHLSTVKYRVVRPYTYTQLEDRSSQFPNSTILTERSKLDIFPNFGLDPNLTPQFQRLIVALISPEM